MTPPRNPGTHDLTTRRVKLSTLRPHPRNARNGDVEAVAESLTVNGQYRPIVVTTDGTILAGNHTYAAALSLGWDRIAAVTVDVAPESPEALRIMLADNRTADLGGYDDALLLDLLRDLDATATQLAGTAYDTTDLELLAASTGPLQFVPDTGATPVRLDTLSPRLCPQCGYDVANDPDRLGPYETSQGT